MSTHVFVPILLFFVLCTPSLSQTVCNSTLTGAFERILVNGSSCTLRDVNVEVVHVFNGGSLRTLRDSRISWLFAINARSILVVGRTNVLSRMLVFTSGDVTIGKQASVFELEMNDSGILKLRGHLRRLKLRRSEGVIVRDGTLEGSLYISGGNPNVQLCNATIGRAVLRKMPVNIQSSDSCPPSSIRSLHLEDPSDFIFVKGINILEEFSTVEENEVRVKNMSISSTKVDGTVHVENVGNVSFTSVHTSGTVTLSNVQSTSIVGSELSGNVTIGYSLPRVPFYRRVPVQRYLFSTVSGCIFEGNVKLGRFSGSVHISGSTFSGKSVEIEANDGKVVLTGNEDLNVKVQKNSVGVELQGNRILDGIVSDNEAIVDLNANRFETLFCTGNNPSPTLISNRIAKGGNGQCASP